MKYDQIPGWFDFHNIYQKAVRRGVRDQGNINFVELGSYKGQSTAYMCELIKDAMNENPGVQFNFYAVDLWKQDESNDHNAFIEKDLFPEFIDNMQKVGVRQFVTPMQMTTESAAKIFALSKLKFDFVFVDANHTYDYVNADIQNYLPLMKKTGVIAGHDIYFADVAKAVRNHFATDWHRDGSSWIHRMPKNIDL
jgi:hypothetical protein